MSLAFWNEFLNYVEQNQKQNPVIYSLLKQLRPGDVADNKITLACENHGIRMYMEKKIPLIEQLLMEHTGKKMFVHLTVDVKKPKDTKVTPLLSFEPSTDDIAVKAGLNLKYHFDNFAVSSTNQVAHAAAQAVAQTPGSSYNPLFLYGGVGVGKTHLAQAIARTVLEKDNTKKVLFSPGEIFMNELVEAIRERSTPKFRRRYRYLTVLIIDDIQFIAGKQTAQEEFFHTFNSIVSAGGQVVLTSDRPPGEMKNLEDRLRSRFSGGLIVDVQPPDFELRTAILLIKAKEKNIEIDMDAARLVAEQVGDTRALEGALLSIYAKTLGKSDKIDLITAASFFEEKITVRARKVAPSDVIKAVCSFYNIKQTHIKSATRVEDIAMPRQIAMFIMRKELRLKFEEIAYILKRKDHTTIMHGVEKVSGMLVKNPILKQEVDRIIQSIQLPT